MRVLLLVLALLTLVAASEAPPSDGVKADRHAEDGAQSKDSPEKIQGSPQKPSAMLPNHQPAHANAPPREHGGDSEDQGTEYWPPFWGIHLKITDSLLALFTALLFFATVRLYVATRNLVTGAEDTAKRQLRAYVGIDDIRIESTTAEDPKFRGRRHCERAAAIGFVHRDFIVLNVKNFGQTPAYDVTCFSHLAWTRFPQRLPDGYLYERDVDVVSTAPVRSTLSRYMLESAKTHATRTIIFDPRPIKAARRRRFNLYVYGRIYYRDIYNCWWRTKFCYSWEPMHPSGPRFIPYENYNEEDQERLLDTAGNPV